jgi:hypothetical protein
MIKAENLAYRCREGYLKTKNATAIDTSAIRRFNCSRNRLFELQIVHYEKFYCIIYHIKLKPLGDINDLNIDQSCRSNDFKEKSLDIFSSKKEFVNDINQNINCQQQTVNKNQ